MHTVDPPSASTLAQAARRLAAPMLLALALSGCESVPEAEQALVREQAYLQHLAWLTAIERFEGAGRLALRLPDDSVSGILDWRQDGDRYDVRLSGPFGQGAVRIEGTPGAVRLSTAEGLSSIARTPEELLSRELGWTVPVSVLRYWILGRTAPDLAVEQLELDGAGRITRMLQGDWDIQYHDYEAVDRGALPRRLEINGPRLRLRLVMTRWTTS